MDRIAAVRSPGGDVELTIGLDDRGTAAGYASHDPDCLVYRATVDGREVLASSRLGLTFDGAPPLSGPFEAVDVERRSHASTRSPPYGERATVADRYGELEVCVRETVPPGRDLRVIARAYDEGLALRYVLPAADAPVTGEHTEFAFPAGAEGYDAHGESPYTRRPVGAVGTGGRGAADYPLTVALSDGAYACVTEAGNRAAPRLRLRGDGEERDGVLGVSLDGPLTGTAPLRTPWRAVVVGETPGDLLERNDLVRNLAPGRARDPRERDWEWVEPGSAIREVTLSTAGGRDCVDFAAEHGLDYVLFDGGWYGPPYDVRTDAATAAPWAWKVDADANDGTGGAVVPDRLDLPAVVEYAADRGIGVWLYLDKRVLERRLDDLLPTYEELGIAGLKFGFVRVGGQGWTEWLHDAVRRCAEHGLMVDVHDDYRPTGLSRTYPNLLTQEGVRGNEHHPTAGHNATLPFTRFVAGAADYTVCYRETDTQPTDAHQLALPVVYYSPLQLLYWYGEPAAFEALHEREFFAAVPTTWDDTRMLEGAVGEYATVARRHGEEWFLGAITDDARTLAVDLDFLGSDAPASGEPDAYVAAVYEDATPGAPVEPGVSRVGVERTLVDRATTLRADLVESGGLAVYLRPADADDRERYPRYDTHSTPG